MYIIIEKVNKLDTDRSYFGTEKISKILLKVAPPVMLAQLILALYNVVDSFFIGKYSGSGLTALSIIYPMQLLMIALAVGTGVGINTGIAFNNGIKDYKAAEETAGTGTPVALCMWGIFAVVSFFIMPFYARISSSSSEVVADVIIYGRIVCVGSIGLFCESIWTKILQAGGDMKTPMIAQISGAITNIILDPILIFGLLGMPEMGVGGAAVATVTGQIVAACVVVKNGYRKPPVLSKFKRYILRIYKLGLPSIFMQSAYTVYILGLNLILSGFSDQAVTVLGLYYKWQTFFIIPLEAMQTCIVPVISYNYAAGRIDRCKKTLTTTIIWGMALVSMGTLSFALFPEFLLRVFSSDPLVIEIGKYAFPIVGIDYILMSMGLTFPVFFQAVGSGGKSLILTLVRTLVLFVPLAYALSKLGLTYFWFVYPITDTVTSLLGFYLYRKFLKNAENKAVLNNSSKDV